MEFSIRSRWKNAWNAFRNKDPTPKDYGMGYYTRPDRVRLTRGNERSIVNAIYSRMATDAAAIKIRHVRTDDDGSFLSEMNTGLNE